VTYFYGGDRDRPDTFLSIQGGVQTPRHSPYIIELTAAERAALEGRARKYTSPYRDVIRAKIILFAAEGLGNDVIAARLDTPRQIVSKWRQRFFKKPLAGLEEDPRGGRAARFSPQRRR
jgi:Homeodomain-like domain